MSLEEAAELGCRACASPGGGCQFLGTAATSQVVAEALGLTVPHAALAPSGQPIWKDVARAIGARRGGHGARRREDARDSHRCRRAQRDGRARGGRRLDEPAAARPGNCPRGRIATSNRRRLARGQPAGAAPGRRAAERPASHDSRLSRWRRPGSDAAPPPRGTARHDDAHGRRHDAGRGARLVGALGAPRGAAASTARQGRRGSRRRDHEPRSRGGTRAHAHGLLRVAATSRPRAR